MIIKNNINKRGYEKMRKMLSYITIAVFVITLNTTTNKSNTTITTTNKK